MALLIPSLVHAACIATVPSGGQPKFLSAIGFKSIARTSSDSYGAFDLQLEQAIDSRTALLQPAAGSSNGPDVSIQAIVDSESPTLVHVYASQNVVASGNFNSIGGSVGSSYGFSGFGHPTTGEFNFTLQTPLTVSGDAYEGVAILVTPNCTKTFASWSVNDESSFKISLMDETGSPVNTGFSLMLLPSGQASFTVDCDFSLLVLDLGAAGVVPASS